MNYAHLHLMLNHIPIMGSLFGLGLLLVSFTGKNADLRRASYIIFASVGLLTVPVFLSGFAAQAMLQGPHISDDLVSRHESSALLSIWFMEMTGALALIGLWQAQSKIGIPRRNVIAVLVFSLLTTGLIARTSNTGGDIRHPEDITGNAAPLAVGMSLDGKVGAFLAYFEPDPAKFSDAVTFSKWWWSFMMAAHFLGLILIVATVGLLDVRILGFFKQLPVAPVHKLLPWGLAGLGINVLTGLLAFSGHPDNYVYSAGLWIKILALMLLGANAVAFYLTDVFGQVEHLKSGEDAPFTAKLVAASGLFLWLVVITMGRYIQPLTDTLLGSN
jgi:hypothetical protein